MTTYAIVPAGGRSVRMGQPKLALPWAGRTVLECVIAVLRQAGIEHILIVVGPQAAPLQALAEAAGAHVVPLPQQTADMRATIECGLNWLQHRFHPHDDDGWLLVPADHPTLKPEVVQQLLAAQQQAPEQSIFIPTYQCRRGHPTWIAWEHVPGIRALPADLGLNAYLRQHAEQTREVPVDSPAVLFDLDTPEDYERLLRSEPPAG